MSKLMREPLFQFLALGLLIFLVNDALNGESGESDPFTIVVDQEQLADFLRFRNKQRVDFELDASLDQLTREQLERLVEDYVEEEAMYREAKALQLDGDDYLARLRAIQRLEFVMRQTAGEASERVDDDRIRAYFDTYREDFLVAPTITFTHVFFSADLHGADRAQMLAEAERRKLNELRVGFVDASRYGDRFLYHLNYAGSGYDKILSHFGRAMLDVLTEIEPGSRTWQGPLRSPHGSHLVMVTRKTAAYLPQLEDVRAEIESRLRQRMQAENYESLRRRRLSRYRVSVEEWSAPAGFDQTSAETGAPGTKRASR